MAVQHRVDNVAVGAQHAAVIAISTGRALDKAVDGAWAIMGTDYPDVSAVPCRPRHTFIGFGDQTQGSLPAGFAGQHPVMIRSP